MLAEIIKELENIKRRLRITELKETPILTVEEQDGIPSVVNVNKIKVTNGTLTDNSGGVVSITTGGGGGGVSDGDYGDITVSSSGTVWTIDNDVVTFAKMQNVSTDRLLGRDTAASGDVEELTASGGLEFSGSGGIQRSALTGDVTASAGSNATTIANDAVTYAKMQNVSATNRLLGRVSSGSGDVEEVTATTLLQMLNTGSAGVLFDHFFTSRAATPIASLELRGDNSGGYTSDGVTPPTADAIGVVAIASNGASGVAFGTVFQTNTAPNISFGTVSLDLIWRFRMSALPASGQDEQIIIGFASSRSITATNAAFLFLDFAAGFTDFRYRTRAAGSQTDVGSGLTAAANTWYKLRIQVDTSGNVTFTIDDANSQTLSTNVPSGTTQAVGIIAHKARVSGTNNRLLYLDYCRFAWSGGPS